MPERPAQQLIPFASQVFQYELLKPAERRKEWWAKFIQWKKELVVQAREKVANDPQLSRELIKLVREVKQVLYLSMETSHKLQGHHGLVS